MDFCFSSSVIPYSSPANPEHLGDTQLIVRTVEARDITSLAETIAHSFHPPEGILCWFYPFLKMGIYEDLRSRLRSRSPHQKCLVAIKIIRSVAGQVEEVVGTVEIGLRAGVISGGSISYISNLAVSRVHRRQGVARKLLLRCEQIAHEWGCQDISLHVLENNHYAKKLYFSCGYQLHQLEFSLSSWLLKQPRRLLLHKKIDRNQKQNSSGTQS
ncbi:GNAT family N-acetyltransferase [Candidatus Gracilibacteria bacterium]|nr:GNAT family N-acetyltransferase [Candidatus Gracilibacteria bacterium]NJM86423.1 GNAT family N-acetyltransferase [Hydrococcus sp. RU_2_2]NJP19575.1 GNAT family N-acetyltransferase [Hydrococcus sp. CRU_1_1]